MSLLRLAPFLLLLPATVSSGPNANTTLVLHAVQASFGVCEIPDPCVAPATPLTNVEPGGPYTIYFLLRNYHDVSAVQFALDWPLDWNFAFGVWDCTSGCICETFPWRPGPLYGVYTCCFNCVTGGASLVLGRMSFSTLTTGCMDVIEPFSPLRTSVLACDFSQVDPILQENRGRVCVGTGGVDACMNAVPVSNSTWGRIKDSYQ